MNTSSPSASKLADQRLREVADGFGDSPRQRVIAMLEERIRTTADKLNTERMRAMRWASIAKQQRQFFKHTEGLGEPPQTLLKKKHPAGEIFCRKTLSWGDFCRKMCVVDFSRLV